jgi:hypothetical protein
MVFCESCGGKLGEKSKFCGSCGASLDAGSEGSFQAIKETAPVQTTFEAKCSILSQVWVEMRDEEEFAQFMNYGDLGIPLAYAIHNDIIESTPEAQKFVDEVFELLLGILGMDEDTGFTNLDELLFEDEDLDTESDEDEDED